MGGSSSSKSAPVQFTYFPVWGKGPACALALEHSGMEWQGHNPTDWASMKNTTPWLELPVMEIPGIGMVGHEVAILNYIGSTSPAMGGATPKEFVVSQQLMQEAEDIYKKLAMIKNGMLSAEDAKGFWTMEDASAHNKMFGIKVFLLLLDKFYDKCAAGEGKFTSSGKTVGECKLWTMLHACKLIKDDVLNGFPGVAKFYERFAAEEQTQSILKSGGKMPGPFLQYFKE